MLNLTRYPGQRIIVTHEPTGDKLAIEVVSISGDQKQVRLGLEASKCFLIDREEIHKDKQAGGNK